MGLEQRVSLFNLTVDGCAEQCVYEDSFFCRSFDYFLETNECRLRTENLVDKLIDLKVTPNELVNHYSSKIILSRVSINLNLNIFWFSKRNLL